MKQAQAQLAEANKRSAALAVSLAKLQADQRAQKSTLVETSASVDAGRNEAAEAAFQANAALEQLRLSAESNAALARKAEAEAKVERAKTESALITAKSDGIKALIWQIFQLAGILLTPLVLYWIGKKTREEAHNIAVGVMGKIDDVHVEAKAATTEVKQLKVDREETAIAQSAQLKQIHSLVNSNLTASKQNELASYESNLLSLQELVDLKVKNGVPVTRETQSAMVLMKSKIAELNAELADRRQQTSEAAQQLSVDIAKLPEDAQKQKLEKP